MTTLPARGIGCCPGLERPPRRRRSHDPQASRQLGRIRRIRDSGGQGHHGNPTRGRRDSVRDAQPSAAAMYCSIAPDGRVVGQPASERTVEELSAEMRRIDPPVFPAVERIGVRGDSEAIAVRADSGPAAPWRYRGTACRRVGNTTQTMPAEEYNRILFDRTHNERGLREDLAALKAKRLIVPTGHGRGARWSPRRRASLPQ